MNIHFHLPIELLAESAAGTPVTVAGSSSARPAGALAGGFVENPPIEDEGGSGAPAIENPPVEKATGFTSTSWVENPPVDETANPASFDAGSVENPPVDADPGGPGGIENPPVED